MTTLLEVQGLAAGYGEIGVLHDVGLRVDEGQVTAVIGSNGAGKTTLMHVLAGLISPSAGEIRMSGNPVTQMCASDRVTLGLSLVPEGRLLFPEFTIEETLKIGAYTSHARDGWRARADEMFELFPRLAERRHNRAHSLSGGEQQMLALARGLMSKPSLLLLDEPSLGLAPMMVELIFRTIEAVRASGVTVLIVEQDVHTTLAVADRAYVLENGRIIAEGAGHELLESPLVRESYLGM